MNIFKKIINYIKTKKILSILVVVAILLFVYFVIKKGDSVETYKIIKKDFEKSVTVSGKVVTSQNVDLAFETGGTVIAVYKSVGDKVFAGETIVALDSSELLASRNKAKADLLAAEAELKKVQSGKGDDSELLSKKQETVDAILDAYSKADDAVRNKVDQYFKNPLESPVIKYTFEDYFDRKGPINDKRLIVEETLIKWKQANFSLTAENYSSKSLSDTRKYLAIVKDFLETLSYAVNSFEVSNDLPQVTIDKYKTDLSVGRANVSTANLNLTTAEKNLRSSTADVPVLEAKVISAEANVASYDAQIAKNALVAPFTGVVSIQEAKVGQSVSANTKITSLISDTYEIEIYIPEVSIRGLILSNTATVILDAYPEKSLDAIVTHIDPAETLKDGVSNYKVELVFKNIDPVIKSGMTADVSIITDIRPDTLLIPERTVQKIDGTSYVYKYTGPKTDPLKTKVEIGEKDGKGNVVFISGLIEGDEILLTPSK